MTSITYLITVYNKALYLPHVFHSLKNQEGDFEREFIFINDGSTDESARILHSYKNQLPNVQIITQNNQGPAYALNRGLALAQSTYIKFLDADDILRPNTTYTLLKAAQKTEADVVFGFSRPGYNPHDPICSFPHIPEDIPLKEVSNPLLSIIQGDISGISAIGSSLGLARRDLMTQIGGCDPHIFIQDYSLSLRLALKGKFTHIPWTVALKPKDNGTSHVSHNRAQEKHDTLLALLNLCAMHTSHPLPTTYATPILRRCRKTIAQLAKQEGLPYAKFYLRYYAHFFERHPPYSLVRDELSQSLAWMRTGFGYRIRRMQKDESDAFTTRA
jgi:glycosyltransferase involved in cell wall biosynthesis